MAAKDGEAMRPMVEETKRSSTDSKPPFWSVVVSVSCLKILFLYSYRSTDFEVHRNWLAITHSLPVSQWYYDETSKWTLDYPPLFAWFEYLLSLVAQFFDPEMLVLRKLNYASEKTVLFQRLSVIASDLVFAYACYVWCGILARRAPARENPSDQWTHPTIFLAILLLWNPGLLIVDHIHFQYNGFLMGLLLLSVARIVQDCVVEGAFWFAVLLNLKHIYLYVAPAFFVYLLRSYCLAHVLDLSKPKPKVAILNFLKLAAVVFVVFGLSFGPFVMMKQTRQLLSRLFPFKRGLTHAYWAPNFWALYNAADKLLSTLASTLKLNLANQTQTASMTGGLVQEYTHQVLPMITPLVTMIISILAMVPILIQLWKRPGDSMFFLRSVILCALASFMFSWHVHEKAILIPLIPLSLLTLCSWEEAQVFSFLAPIAHFSLFPLLYREAETPLKILLLLLHAVYTFMRISSFPRSRKHSTLPLLDRIEIAYLCGIVILQAYSSFGSKLIGLDKRLPFLPLLLTSVYCGFGVLYSFLQLYILVWTMDRDLQCQEPDGSGKSQRRALRNKKQL